jgi:hypothetical protein
LNVRPDIVEVTESVEGRSSNKGSSHDIKDLDDASLKKIFFNENLSEVQDVKLMKNYSQESLGSIDMDLIQEYEKQKIKLIKKPYLNI